jgi:hypothetical protein
VLTVKVEETRLEAQRRRAAAALLVESNRSAERDTTRDVALENARVAKLLGDSLRVVEKEVVQASQKGDALDAALGRERAARYAATALVDSLARVVATAESRVRGARDSAGSSDTRTARFEIREAPYTIVADVDFPPPPDSARLRSRLVVDPIPIEARVTCAGVAGGAREATVSVETPSWVTVRLGTVAQSPDVCARPVAMVARGMRERWPEELGQVG